MKRKKSIAEFFLETKFYFFMCAVHYRSQTLFSHMVSSFDTLQSNGQIIFSNRMIIREVESHFAATIGVYCMVNPLVIQQEYISSFSFQGNHDETSDYWTRSFTIDLSTSSSFLIGQCRSVYAM